MMTYSTQAKHAIYQANAVDTAGPAQLVLMLYDGALAAIGRAQVALAANDIAGSHDELLKSQEIVAELAASLDVTRGGDIATSIGSLYDFCQRGLISANLRKSDEPLPAVVEILAGLRDAWLSVIADAS
jgi:flagellar protein FliS